jgi:DNA-binding NarL/FixJ family response regulator
VTDARAGATGLRASEDPASEPRLPEVAVVADDLIWATRLGSIVRAAGARATVVGSADRLAQALGGKVAGAAGGVIVDLGTRRSDPVIAIEAAVRAGRSVVAVGAHEDIAARKRALAAGALRVYAYSQLFEDGPRTIAAWLGLPIPDLGPAAGPSSGSGQAGR